MKCNSETLIFSLFFFPKLAWKPNKTKKKETFSLKKKKPIFPIHHTTNQTKHIKHSFHFPYFLVNFLSNQTTYPLTLYPKLKQKQTQKSICMNDLWWRNKQYQIAGLWTKSRKADVSRRSPKQSRWSLIELRVLEQKSWDGLLLQ